MKKWAYYNEIDRNAAAWIRELMKRGLIAPGEVDERSILDVQPDDVRGFAQAHWFAGIAVWSHALRGAGWSDDRPIWTGSCPCQPFSAAGKGGGFDDERHLWPAFHYLIEQCRPDVVLGEQVASKDGLGWLDLVHADLEGTGYAVGAVDTCAAGFGAPHIRQRLWWVGSAVADADHEGLEGRLLQRERAGECAPGTGGVAGRLADAVRDGAGDDAGAGLGSEAAPDREDGRLSRERLRSGIEGPLCALAESGTNSTHPVPAPQLHTPEPDRLDDHDGDGPRQAVGGVHLGCPQPDRGQLRPGPTNGWWGAPDWLHCRDGRWRPVESGTFPLVDGLAQRVVRGRDSSEPVDAQRSAEARVMRLRGYGNAIVASAATAFIESVMEAVA